MRIMVKPRSDFVSPRFDKSLEVIIATCYDQQLLEEPHSLVLSNVTAEVICDLALKEKIDIVICGGIEEQHYQFLIWKKIRCVRFRHWTSSTSFAVGNGQYVRTWHHSAGCQLQGKGGLKRNNSYSSTIFNSPFENHIHYQN